MENELAVINEQEVLGKQFRMYGTVEQPLFLAKDVAEWIDYAWANSKQVSRDVSRMLRTVDEDEKLTGTIFLSGQNREMWFLTEDGLYEVLMQSRKPIAKQFKKKVKEILKEIRKTGQYVVKPMDSYMIDDPIERAKAWIKEEEKRMALAAEVKELTPLAEQTTKYIEKGHLIGIRALAKELNVKENLLRYVVDDVLGWRYKQGNGYKAYKWVVTEGYMETKDAIPGITRDYFTVKGRMRVEEELKKIQGNQKDLARA
nr:BRO family protein [Selenomonas ruminantium]